MSRREQVNARPGYFGIGIYNCKTPINMGTLWRSAACLGAAFTFQIGGRYERHCSDTVKTWRKLPHFTYPDVDAWRDAIPYDCVPVAVELTADAIRLGKYQHPQRAVYLLGAEDHGIPPEALAACQDTVILPGTWCVNVAVAGSIVMYDRTVKAARRSAPAEIQQVAS